jgi:hypothetical protein
MNEINSVVNALIEEVENKNPLLVNAIDCNGKKFILNITELKNSKKCQRSNVFNYLMNFQDNSSRWKRHNCCNHCLQNLWDDEKRFNLLRLYNINLYDWDNFLHFLRHDHPPFFGAWVNGGDNEIVWYNKVVNWLENVNATCNKLGGFPDFDDYYDKFWEGNISNEAFGTCVPPSISPPSMPNDDLHEKYLWLSFIEGSIAQSNFLSNIFQQSRSWTQASVQERASGPERIWYRRKSS